jgi:hypothetical protein
MVVELPPAEMCAPFGCYIQRLAASKTLRVIAIFGSK